MRRDLSNSQNLAAAAALWIVSAVWYLLCETIAVIGFPGYSYENNYISDLGVPGDVIVQGRHLHSHLSMVMNAGFLGQALLFLLAAILLWSQLARSRLRGALVLLATAYSFGLALVGLVSGTPENFANKLGLIHVLGALVSIIGGNIMMFLIGWNGRRMFVRLGCSRSLTILSVAGLLSLCLLCVNSFASRFIFGDGIWERGSVYTIMISEVVLGLGLLEGIKTSDGLNEDADPMGDPRKTFADF